MSLEEGAELPLQAGGVTATVGGEQAQDGLQALRLVLEGNLKNKK